MLSKFLSIFCVCATALVFSADLRADIFNDNFDTGASPLWGNESGSWSDSSGVYRASVPDNFPNAHSSLPFNLTDFSVELNINDVADGGVWLRSEAAAGTTIGRTGVLLITGVGGGLYWHNVTMATTTVALTMVCSVCLRST